MQAWMIYGANGLTGGLIAREAHRRGYKPILAGRSAAPIERLGKAYGMPVRVFPVDSAARIAHELHGVAAVLHCAGPFSATHAPMFEACLETRTHYLDITGEIAVFETVHANTARAKAAGISAIPGVGFDVVGSDCLAALLKRELPDAIRLKMGMQWVGGRMSKGTIKSMVEGVAKGGCIRRDGKLTTVSSVYNTERIPFQNDRERFLSICIPWGDVSTAYYSTGIQNIEFYFAKSLPEIAAMHAVERMRGVIARPAVQALIKSLVERLHRGPTDAIRAAAESYVWGEVENAAGQKAAKRMRMPEGYTFTYLAALASMERVLAGGIPTGALTPSMAFGADFAGTLQGVSVEPAAALRPSSTKPAKEAV